MTISSTFASRQFKRIIFVAGSLFLVATIVISADPEPFLAFGYVGVFVFNLIGPGTLLVPILARHMNVVLLAVASASGMVLNDSVSWVVGRSGDVVVPRSKKVENLERQLRRYGPVALFFWSLAPVPYDVIGLVTGYLGFPYRRVILPMFLGKFLRFLILGSSSIAVFGRT